jgi:hypothetical protein
MVLFRMNTQDTATVTRAVAGKSLHEYQLSQQIMSEGSRSSLHITIIMVYNLMKTLESQNTHSMAPLQ